MTGDAEVCCGGRAYQMGYQEDFLAQARKNMALVKQAGVKTVVTACADGYQAFKVLYDKFHLKDGLEVLHISEYVAKLIHEGKLKLQNKIDLSVTYHDPCRLGRLGEPWVHWQGKKFPVTACFRSAQDLPSRHVWRLSAPPGCSSEHSRHKTHGNGPDQGIRLVLRCRGGVSDSNPEFAQWTAQERIEEAAATGAEALVTACPWCEKTFEQAIRATGSRLKVYDIVELVEKAIA